MENLPREINFLSKPKLDKKKLDYLNKEYDEVEIYVNLFKIMLSKELILYQYPYSVTPEIEPGDLEIRKKIFQERKCSLSLKQIYGKFFHSGDSIYAMNKITDRKMVTEIRPKGTAVYDMEILPLSNMKVIKGKDVEKDELAKSFIELLIKDILSSNPNLEYDNQKGFFVMKNKIEEIKAGGVSINFSPGYKTSFMLTERGNFLNVSIKNKIINSDNILEFLKENKYTEKRNQEVIREYLKEKSFKTSYSKRNYQIDDISFDKNPINTTCNVDGKTENLVDYYQKAHGKKIKDLNQPLIVVKTKGDQPQTLYFIPEFCHITGLDDSQVKDGQFMRKLADYTKLSPDGRVKKTDDFLKLLVEEKKFPDPKNEGKMSSKEKSELYGIKVLPLEEPFTGYYMTETQFIGDKNKKINLKDKVFPVLDKKDMTNWVCFYEKCNYNDAEKLSDTLLKASKGFGFNISEPEWIEMENKKNVKEWLDTAGKYVGEGKTDYDFAVFLLNRNTEKFYPKIKKHSLCTNGYVSQVVTVKALQKNTMSVCSKILLQINAKLQGASYSIKLSQDIKEKKLMLIGIDSSHIKGQRTGVAMVSTINKSFTNFFSKELIVKNDEKAKLKAKISEFIDYAYVEYSKENKNESPNSLIIYRQGVSMQQKEFLKDEIREIDSKCKEKNIKYYYILVNTKTNYKIFEKTRKGYVNPYAGLLVIDGIIDRNKFEFYIQPQEVTGGTATPTCFHVAYGDMECPSIVPKITYDLCHIYSNWQGPVRVPHVIKAAEKLSKMTAKYTGEELNKDLEHGQAFL